MKNYTVQQLVNAGGSEWKKNELHRVYFNNLHTIYGLEFDCYNTGNISSAKLNGEKISNGKATKLFYALSSAKIYFDLNAKKFIASGLGQETSDEIIEKIEQIITTSDHVSNGLRLACLMQELGSPEYMFRTCISYEMRLGNLDSETADQLLDDEIDTQLKNGDIYCHVYEFEDQGAQKLYFYTRS